MGSLETWGAIAATVLLIECIIFNLIFLALSFGLWKGAEWMHRNAALGLTKVDGWLQTGRRYTLQGQSFVAAPFVRLRGQIEGWRSMRARLRG